MIYSITVLGYVFAGSESHGQLGVPGAVHVMLSANARHIHTEMLMLLQHNAHVMHSTNATLGLAAAKKRPQHSVHRMHNTCAILAQAAASRPLQHSMNKMQRASGMLVQTVASRPLQHSVNKMQRASGMLVQPRQHVSIHVSSSGAQRRQRAWSQSASTQPPALCTAASSATHRSSKTKLPTRAKRPVALMAG